MPPTAIGIRRDEYGWYWWVLPNDRTAECSKDTGSLFLLEKGAEHYFIDEFARLEPKDDELERIWRAQEDAQ